MFGISFLVNALIEGIIDGFKGEESAESQSEDTKDEKKDPSLERGMLVEQAIKYPWSMSFYGLDQLFQKYDMNIEVIPAKWGGLANVFLGPAGYLFTDKSEARKQYADFKEDLSDKFTGIGKWVYDKDIPIVSDLAGGFTGTADRDDVNYYTMKGSFYKGLYVDGLLGTVDGVVGVGLDPVGTVKNLTSVLAHPEESARAIGNNIGDFCKNANGNDWAALTGQITFEVLTEVATGGAAGGAKAGKVIDAVDDVSDTAKTTNRLLDVAEDLDDVADASKAMEKGQDAASSAEHGVNIKPEVDDVKVKEVPDGSGGDIGITKDSAKKVEYGEQFTKGKNGRKELKPNVEYTTPEGYTYTTDDAGRITNAEGTLTKNTAKRNSYSQKVAGREDRLPTDDGGHLIASIFDGSGDLDNLVPMDATLNRGEWKVMENTWSKALDSGKKVEVKIEPVYNGLSQRPISFDVEYKIGDGDWIWQSFDN
ncbi:DNA/RNA non-specific endonuclease [Anaeromicropila populeti]|uniref:DNA/RNA non-specific endonuclease n=1 Tax=Anaeromicropila populeti TaxID=37658 RepID=A0A1I6HU07_9FIRM|nr:DNA/RNA non-specific endonuclease [Anaeromicropila populeti]SFR57730.1 DNA/RNA non-specific endonuclease [Anaeromicropila populeti]